jgi:hypothetical protein
MKRTLRACAGACALAALALAGCSRYPSAEVSGYVKDSGLTAGVVGATVRIYLSEPSAADAAGAAAETATAYNLTVPGYFDRKIMWATSAPAFQEQGDTIPIWVSVTHPDFTSRIVKVPGVLSGTQNIVPDILVQRQGFTMGSLSGTVTVTNPLTPVIVKIGIDFDPASVTETDAYTVYTTCAGGAASPFSFANIHWTNTSPSGTGFDQKQVKLWITATGISTKQLPGVWLVSSSPTTPSSLALGTVATFP